MKSVEFERWDNGRLTVNCEIAHIFRHNGLTTFEDFIEVRGTVAKDFLAERTTVRFALADPGGGEQAFYVKRHAPVSWKEYVKPLVRLTMPLLGARHEWEAILQFQRAGINTMTPAALGEDGSRSFLVTRSLEGFEKLSRQIQNRDQGAAGHGWTRQESRDAIIAVASLARRMHGGGLHHQDFYTHHLLVSGDGTRQLYVIDLGRVQHRPRLARRWIVKDLAQLSYSAPDCSATERLRFLRAYLGRRLLKGDRRFVQQVLRKVRHIARHSEKHSL